MVLNRFLKGDLHTLATTHKPRDLGGGYSYAFIYKVKKAQTSGEGLQRHDIVRFGPADLFPAL